MIASLSSLATIGIAALFQALAFWQGYGLLHVLAGFITLYLAFTLFTVGLALVALLLVILAIFNFVLAGSSK